MDKGPEAKYIPVSPNIFSEMTKKTMSIHAEIYTAAVSISGLIRLASAYVFTTAFSHNNT